MDHAALSLALLLVPLFVTPLLVAVALLYKPSVSMPTLWLQALLAMIAVSIIIPLGLQALELPINRLTQQWAAAALALPALTTVAIRTWRHPLALSPCPASRMLLIAGAILMLVVAPWTHFTGIDTYKWQDFSSAVIVGQRIPWIDSGWGLFGLVPRSYPSAFPLLLASCQLPAAGAIQPGYAIASWIVALTGLLSAYHLGCALFRDHRLSTVLAIAYAFSPVFTRYSHWATGRGLFLALYPLLLASTLTLSWRGLPLLLLQSLILLLCHKVALVAVPLALLGWAIGALVHRPLRRRTVTLTAAAALAVLFFMLLAAPGILSYTDLPRFALTRYIWLLPAAVFGMVAIPSTRNSSQWWAFMPACIAIPALAFDPTMYGAMIVLPAICVLAVLGLDFLRNRTHRSWIVPLALAISLGGALAIVVQRSHMAASDDLCKVAAAIDAQATGPVQLVGMYRHHAQAYVLAAPGCWAGNEAQLAIRAPFGPGLQWGERIQRLRWMARPSAPIEWVHPQSQQVLITTHEGPAPPNGAKLIARSGDIAAYQVGTP